MNPRTHLSKAKRIVAKVGTASLTDEHSKLDSSRIQKLVDEVMELVKEGREVILITSGAIGAGIGRLGMKDRPRDLSSLQAVAAVGQGILMETYENCFRKYGQPVAQVLLTREDFIDPVRYKNFENTLNQLLRWKTIPIINENDTVAVEEIKVGDNDTLSAFTTTGIRADLLIMLSDVDGLYNADPKQTRDAKLIKTVEAITPEIEKLAGNVSKRGFGGMMTKVQAAKVVTEFGIPVVVANGSEKNVLKRVLEGEEIGTLFIPRGWRDG